MLFQNTSDSIEHVIRKNRKEFIETGINPHQKQTMILDRDLLHDVRSGQPYFQR